MKLFLLFCLTLSSAAFGLGGEEPPTDDGPPPPRRVKKKCVITTTTEARSGKQKKEVERLKVRSMDECVDAADRRRAEPLPSFAKSRNVHYDWVGPAED